MAEAADKNALTDEQLRRVINMLMRPKGGQPAGKVAFDPAKEPTNIAELAQRMKGGTESLDKLVSRLGIGKAVTKGVLGAADLTNQYAKDAFKSDREFQDTFSFGGDPNAEGTLWPAGSGVLMGTGTRMAARTLPEALKTLGPIEKSALVGAKAGSYGAWLKDHSSHDTQAGVDDAVLQIGKTISEQSGYVQERLKKMMGDKAFNWAKQQNKPVFSPQSMNDPKFGPTMKALGEAGIKLPGQQQGDGKGPGSILGIFAGPYGAANLAKSGYPQPQQALDMAKKLHDEGAAPNEIYKITSDFLKDTPFGGVSQIKDGQFRFEIPDNGMKIKKNSGRMDEAVDHPLFFKAYPKMADRPIDIGEYTPGSTYIGGYYQDTGQIDVNSKDPLRTLAHEFNHAAQHFEGDMYRGDTFNRSNYQTQNDFAKDYYKQFSEAEAEESAARQQYTPAKRRAWPPFYSTPSGASELFIPHPKEPARWYSWMGERPKPPSKPTQVSEAPDSFAGLIKQLLAAYRRQLAKDTGKTVPSP
jgi:hypothetical protein